MVIWKLPARQAWKTNPRTPRPGHTDQFEHGILVYTLQEVDMETSSDSAVPSGEPERPARDKLPRWEPPMLVVYELSCEVTAYAGRERFDDDE